MVDAAAHFATFVQGKVQRRFIQIELGIAGAYFRRLFTKQTPIKLKGRLQVPHIDGHMGLQYHIHPLLWKELSTARRGGTTGQIALHIPGVALIVGIPNGSEDLHPLSRFPTTVDLLKFLSKFLLADFGHLYHDVIVIIHRLLLPSTFVDMMIHQNYLIRQCSNQKKLIRWME